MKLIHCYIENFGKLKNQDISFMEGCQCFLTCTSLAGLERAGMKDIHAYRCENGTLREM